MTQPFDTVLDVWPIDLGDLRLGRVDEAGGEWVVTAFAGYGSAPPQIEVTQRSGAHGAWVGGRWYAAKPYTIDVAYSGETPEARFDAEQKLLAAASLRDTTLIMHQEIPRQAQVLANGEVNIDPINTYAFTAQVPLIAPDPFRYALTPYQAETGAPDSIGGMTWNASWPAAWGATITSGTVQVFNAGNADSYPVMRVYGGPLDSFTIAHVGTGKYLTVDLAAGGETLADGEWLEIDLHCQTVRRMGTTDMRRYLRGDLFGLPPGLNELRFSPSLAGGGVTQARLTVTGYSTWL